MKAIIYLKSSKWKKNRKKTHRKKYTNTNHRIKYDRESVFRLFAIFSNFIFSSWVKFSSCAITIDMVSCRCCTQLVRISSRRTFYVFIRFFLVSFSITHFTSLFPCCFFVVVDISFSSFFLERLFATSEYICIHNLVLSIRECNRHSFLMNEMVLFYEASCRTALIAILNQFSVAVPANIFAMVT